MRPCKSGTYTSLGRLILFALSLLWVSPQAFAQTFEGKIVYQNHYISKMGRITNEQIGAAMGTQQEYYLKGARYKSVTNGTLSQWQLYVPADNRLYSKLSLSDTLFWTDGKKDDDPVVSFEIVKAREEVLGVMCDVMVVKTTKGSASYYFSSTYAVDPTLFKDHVYGNWAFLMEHMKAVPLKMEVETPQIILTSVAIAVEAGALEDRFFELPGGVATKESKF